MFILNYKGEDTKYPKYLVLLNDSHFNFASKNNNTFYYVLSNFAIFDNVNKVTLPEYLITLNLNFYFIKTRKKFNLSKLGTDYIVNTINLHYKSECKGNYPDNYVFVNEPHFPPKNYRTNLKFLKNFKGY